MRPRARVTVHTPLGRALELDAEGLLSPALRERAPEEAYRWIKELRLVRYDGLTMRERFTYRGDSLWWFTELYLHKMRRLDTAAAMTLALEAAREEHRPTRIDVDSPDPVVRSVASAFGRAHGLPVDVANAVLRSTGARWSGYLVGASAALSRLRPARPIELPRAPVVTAFVHTAFWRRGVDDPDNPQHESYVGPVLDALATRAGTGAVFLVGIGPRRNFRARRWWDPLARVDRAAPLTSIEQLAPRSALAASRALWRSRRRLARELTTGEAVRAAGLFRGLDLWPVLERELEAAALVQWPWSARAMDEAAAALEALKPKVVVTYAEAGGWGRALVLEARRRRIRSVGLQHGFIYRHWLNYRHEPDEVAAIGSDPGFPLPDRTLVFDRLAADQLVRAGRFPPSRVAITGNARLDDLAARIRSLTDADRAAVRRRLGARDSQVIVVLAAKFSEIAGELAPLGAAVAGLAGVRLVIKPHPAETPDLYGPLARTAPNISIAPPDADLSSLLAVAGAIVTRNSTVAIDCLVLGVPALVLGLPNNLSPFVGAGVMIGVERPEALGQRLESLLYDRGVEDALARATRDFVSRHDLRADGGAAARTAEAILELAQTTTP